MLKNLFIGLILLSVFSNAIVLFPQSFDRPWDTEYLWPNNASIVSYTQVPLLSPAWDIYATQASVDNLALTAVQPYLEDKYITAAKSNYSKTKELYAQTDSFVEYGVWPFFFNIQTFCRELFAFNNITNNSKLCSCIIVDGIVNCQTINPNKEFRYIFAKRWFSGDYSIAWKGTMNNALDALAKKTSELNKALIFLEQEYARVNYTGACERGVPGKQACENVFIFINQLDVDDNSENITLFDIRTALANNALRVYDDIPLIEFAYIINFIGNTESGALAEINNLTTALSLHLNKTERNYKVLRADAELAIKKSENISKTASYHELWRITRSTDFKDIIGENSLLINQEVQNGFSNLDASKKNLETANMIYAYQNQGYLKNAIINTTNAKALALSAKDNFENGIENAKTLVLDYETKAYNSILNVEKKFTNKIWPVKAVELYNNAKTNYENAKNEDRLGLKFEYYAFAIKNAQQAYKTSLDERESNWSVIAVCNNALALIKRAEQDGIDTSFEKAKFLVLNRSNNVTELIFGCTEITESIIASAKHYYQNLESLRSEITDLFYLCSDECADLKTELEKTEKGLVLGNIIYPEAIGSLKLLEDKYYYIRTKSIESIRIQIANHLLVKKNFFKETPTLDKPATTNLEIEVVNTLNYSAKDIKITVQSPIPFSEEDLVQGREKLRGVTYLSENLTLYINQIQAFEKIVFVFEKNTTLLKTQETEKRVLGRIDFSARVEENRTVLSELPITGFYLNENWSTLTINGLPAVIENDFVKNHLLKGIHSFKAKYDIQKGYSKETLNASAIKIGSRTYYTQKIRLTPFYDMESIETFIPLPASPYLKEPRILTLTGEKIKSTEIADGQILTIFNLLEEKTVRFEISYYIDNSSEYVRSEIEKLSQLNLSNETKTILSESESLLLSNNTADAVKKIQQAHDQIKKEEISIEKLRKDNEKKQGLVLQELKKINSVLNTTTTNPNNEFIVRLLERQAFLNNTLLLLEQKTMKDQYSILENYDTNWLTTHLNALKKNISKELNIAYAHYLELNTSNLSIETNFAELRTLYARFDASNSLEDGYILLNELSKTKERVGEVEKTIEQEYALLSASLDLLKSEVNNLFRKYKREYDEAKETRFEGLFKPAASEIADEITKLERELKNKNIKKIHNGFEQIKKNLNNTLGHLNFTANKNAVEIKKLFETLTTKLSEKEFKKTKELISALEFELLNENFVKALKTEDKIMKILSSTETKQEYDLILWLSVVFVIGVLAIYYYKEQKISKPKKIFKKLEKAD